MKTGLNSKSRVNTDLTLFYRELQKILIVDILASGAINTRRWLMMFLRDKKSSVLINQL